MNDHLSPICCLAVSKEIIKDVCDFLKVPVIDIDKINTHRNPSRVPESLDFQLIINSVFEDLIKREDYLSHLPFNQKPGQRSLKNRILLLINQRLNDLNLIEKDYPPMKSSARKFLEKLFYKENKGLSDLIDKDLFDYWSFLGDVD